MLLHSIDLKEGNIVMPKQYDGKLYKVNGNDQNVTLTRLKDGKIFPIRKMLSIGVESFYDCTNYMIDKK